jgi:hypothetical protein
LTKFFALLLVSGIAAPAFAQEAPTTPAPIVFQSGTGEASATPLPVYVKPPRATIDCEALALSARAIGFGYYDALGDAPKQRLDGKLFQGALAKYRAHYCAFGRSSGPAEIVVVDFAKHSSEPRLWRVDLRDGDGLDSPIRVAHGIGSDPDDDGYATVFSNVYNSFTSSLGAALGAERYVGQNGLSLRLDGLEPSNSQMRYRDIVVHSYAPDRRRYFNASLISARGRPGSSEGCFVVEPERREWVYEVLENGGFLYSGFSGTLPQPIERPATNVTFVQGTGGTAIPAAPAAALPSLSEMSGGTGGSQPTAPLAPAPAAGTQ